MEEKKLEEVKDERAVGILEVFGLTTAFLAADAGCKAGDVTLETSIRTNRQMRMHFRFHCW